MDALCGMTIEEIEILQEHLALVASECTTVCTIASFITN